MMLSSAGVGETAGKLIFMRPVKHTGFSAAMSNSGSLVIKPQAASSISSVKLPEASMRLDMVNDTGVGVGV